MILILSSKDACLGNITNNNKRASGYLPLSLQEKTA
jgi:hypothetical protein